MTKKDVDKAAKSYKNKRRKVLGSFTHTKKLKAKNGGLVVMIGSIDSDTINVVDIMVDNELVEHVIRKK